MPCTPKNEVPCDAVPQTNEQHCCELTDENHHPCRDGFISAYPAVEGIEEVGTEPLGEGHVPVVPELGQVGFGIG